MRNTYSVRTVIIFLLLITYHNHNFGFDSTNITNDFYDNSKTYDLSIKPIFIDGEVETSGEVTVMDLPLRQVIVKETVLKGKKHHFIGSYRYDGYSLHDILNQKKIKKSNLFKPITDVYVLIENKKGEKVIFSWGEIYYTSNLHKIIIACAITPITPFKTKEKWPISKESKVVAGTDLLTQRNIDNPTKITIKSWSRKYKILKGMAPLYSPLIKLYIKNKYIQTIEHCPVNSKVYSYNTIFYGRGRGLHSTSPISGIPFKVFFANRLFSNQNSIKNGLVGIAAADGYRALFSFGEIFNRNDQSEMLLIFDPKEKDGGAFRIFVPSDFFSDRAVKGITEIRYFNSDEE